MPKVLSMGDLDVGSWGASLGVRSRDSRDQGFRCYGIAQGEGEVEEASWA